MVVKHIFTGLLMVGLSGCASTPTDSSDPQYQLSQQCDNGLDVAYKELSFSEAKGFAGSWEYTKATSLLSAAKVQASFGGYDGCIEKVNSARAYIQASQKQASQQ